MKRCRHCGQMKSISNFAKHPETKDRLQSWCRDCKSQYGNPQRQEVKIKIREYKEKHGCYYCGERNVNILDFHHVTGKTFGLDLSHSRNWSLILEEIKKCIILCKPCHSKEHSRLGRIRKSPQTVDNYRFSVENQSPTVDKSNKFVDKLFIN